VPVAGEPLVRRILSYAARGGVREAVLNLHHLPETITRQVGDGADLGVRIRYSFESPVLGSAGGPRRALPLLPDEFFIINGDTLTDVDLDALARNHRETGALVTIAVGPNQWPDRYGGLIVDSSGRFHSAVPRGSHVGRIITVGVQIARPRHSADLQVGDPAESIRGVYPRLSGDLGAFGRSLQGRFPDRHTRGLFQRVGDNRQTGRPFPPSGRDPLSIDRPLTDAILWDESM
jgi:NDP-sugar pyrophosphorylase family protein